jgi:hypothetical protein
MHCRYVGEVAAIVGVCSGLERVQYYRILHKHVIFVSVSVSAIAVKETAQF